MTITLYDELRSYMVSRGGWADRGEEILQSVKALEQYLTAIKNENISLIQELQTLKALKKADDDCYQRMKEVAFNQLGLKPETIELPSGDIRKL